MVSGPDFNRSKVCSEPAAKARSLFRREKTAGYILNSSPVHLVRYQPRDWVQDGEHYTIAELVQFRVECYGNESEPRFREYCHF